MTLSPRTVRLDLKCGKGAISKGEKCHKGPATEVSQANTQKTIATVAVIGGVAAAGILGKRAWDANAARRLAQAKKSGFKPATPPPQSTYLSAGNNGKVYISKDRKSIFKITTNKESMSKFAQELTTQETVRALGVNTPKIKAADPVKGLVEMDFLDGYLPVNHALRDRIPQAQKSAIRNSLLSNMSKLHKAGWGHGDFHYKNVLYKDGDVAVIDWGNGAKDMVRIREDIWRTIQLSESLSIDAERAAVTKAGKRFMNLSDPKQKDVDAFYDQLNAALNYSQRADAQRFDLKCGKGAISKGEKCHKGPAREVLEKAAPVALGLGLAAGLIALHRRGKKPRIGDGKTVPNIPKNPPKPPPNSSNSARTAEMAARAKAATERGLERIRRRVRENPQEVAWEMQAENIKNAALRDVTRSKKFNDVFKNINREPSKAPDTLEDWAALASNPEGFRNAMRDPATGQPRRRKTQGFGRRDNYIQHYAPVQLQPPTRRDACWEGYEQVGMKRKGKRRVPNCVPTKKRAQADTEDGKKYSKTVTDPKTGRTRTVRYGAKGYKIAPGTNKGDRYCARSFGDMKSHGKDCSGKDRNTPLCLSRAKWKCSGKTSRRS